MKEKLKMKLNKLKTTGFFSIFISDSLAKVITFLGAIVLGNILSKNDYGIYAAVTNAVSMLLLLNDFGVSSASLQYLVENSDNLKKQNQILNSAIKIGIFAAILGSILILLSPFFYPFTIVDADRYTPILFFIPILNLFNGLIPTVLRSHMENKKFAKLNFVTTIINYVFLIPLTLIFGVMGTILTKYAYSISCFIYGFILIKPILSKMKGKESLEKSEHNDFFKFSIMSQINNTISGLLIIVDTFMIGYLIKDSEILATYKVASTIPQALAFIPASIMVYTLPYFTKHNKDKVWVKKNYKKFIGYNILFLGFLCLILILASSLIFSILYKDKYMDSVLPFNILIIGFFFSAALKTPTANIVYTMRKVKINVLINVIAIIINVISNYILINMFSYVGAALTTTIINIIEAIFYICYINKLLGEKNEESICKNNS